MLIAFDFIWWIIIIRLVQSDLHPGVWKIFMSHILIARILTCYLFRWRRLHAKSFLARISGPTRLQVSALISSSVSSIAKLRSILRQNIEVDKFFINVGKKCRFYNNVSTLLAFWIFCRQNFLCTMYIPLTDGIIIHFKSLKIISTIRNFVLYKCFW